MIFRGSTVAVLVIAAVGALVAMIALPSTVPSPERIDRHSGQPIATPAEHLRRARSLGDAVAALGLLDALDPEVQSDEQITRARATLRGELDDPGATPTLADRAVPEQPLELVAWLADASHDADQAAAVESFFVAGDTGLDAQAAALAVRLRERDPAQPQDLAARALQLAERFAAAGRPRARLRWLLRSFELDPGALPARDALARWLVAAGRLPAAAAVLGARRAGDPLELDLLRAQLARWLDRPEAEIALLETILPARADPADRAADHRRLVELHLYLGAPERALPHAVALAHGTGAAADLDAAAELAFAAGDSDLGFELLLDRLHGAAPGDAEPLRRALLTRAERDLRLDLALQLAAELAGGDPFGADAEHLRRLLHRQGRLGELADLLASRSALRPDDAALCQTLVPLLIGLGRDRDARRVAARLAHATTDPDVFVAWLGRFASARVGDLDELTATWLADPRLAPDRHLPRVLAELADQRGRFPRSVARLEALHLDAPGVRAHLLAECDALPTPAARLRLAGALAERHPGDAALLAAWADRATWAGDADGEIRARRWLRLAAPDDLRNRELLGLRLAAEGRHLEAAAVEAARAVVEPDPSGAILRTVRALIAARMLDVALPMLADRLRDEALATDERRELADLAFAEQALDIAGPAYDRVLRDRPDDAVTLLRAAQLRAWSDDPAGAVPLLERRLAVAPDREPATVHYQLAEALQALGDPAAARPHYAAARAALAPAAATADRSTLTMLARCAARLGDPADAERLLRPLVDAHPTDVALALDLADVLVAGGRPADATPLVERALRLEPHGERTVRAAAAHFGSRGQTERARALWLETLERDGDDPWPHAELAAIGERTGTYRDALEHAERWLALQPGSAAARATERRLRDRLAHHAVATVRRVAVGDDSTTELIAAGSARLTDALRLDAGIGHARYVGRADAVDGSATDITTDTARLDLSVDWRVGAPRDVVGAGIEAFPGAGGPATVGGWVGLHTEWTAPFRSLELRAFVQELWTDSAAAPGLGGRQDGLEGEFFTGLGERGYGGASLRLRRLGADLPGAGREHDLRVDGQLSLGRRLWGTDAAVADSFRLRRTPALPSSPYLAADDARARSQGLAWLAWQSIRQLGDRALADALPIGERFDYLVAGFRSDVRLADGLGAKVEGHVNYELHEAQPGYGIELGATWRPRESIEGTLRFGYGSAVGRSGSDEGSLSFATEWVLRW
ncbi:MAG: tetratricopeptide repeat protein [Planctomycetes bacterium]|nr:tetratricopeptide repeat protein [Planctomycetota bacterium]